MALTRLLAAAAAAGLAAAQTSYAPATTSRLLAGAGEDTVPGDTVFDGKLMIMHTPKTGGTTFRTVVFGRARSMTKSLQTYYGHRRAPCGNQIQGAHRFVQKSAKMPSTHVTKLEELNFGQGPGTDGRFPRRSLGTPGRRAKKSDLERLRQPPGPGGTGGAASAAFNDCDATQDAVARGTAAAASRRNFGIWPRRRERAGPRRSRREGFRYINFHLHSR